MNASLYGKEYTIPDNILSILKGQNSKRSNNLVRNGKISYSLLKKMKSDIDLGMSDYGIEVKNWINTQLRNSRSDVHDIKKNQMDTGMMNRFKKAHTKDKNVNPTQSSEIETTHKEFMREGKRVVRLTEGELKTLIEGAILEEIYNISKDPKAWVLLDYLSDHYPEEEYGLANIEYDDDHKVYSVHSTAIGAYSMDYEERSMKNFFIFTDDELMKYKDNPNSSWKKEWVTTKMGKYNIVD